MKQRLFVFAAVLSLLILAVPSAARAANAGAQLDAKVPHAFMVGDKSFPAGNYTFVTRRDSGPAVLTIRAASGGDSTPITVMTRLAPMAAAGDKSGARLVFDTVGDQRFLSEVWFAGQDGYLVRGTTEDHKHDVVSGTN